MKPHVSPRRNVSESGQAILLRGKDVVTAVRALLASGYLRGVQNKRRSINKVAAKALRGM
jgi:hypothetical protein